mmetsp:Transcript_7156/g.17968  ORF Transcript_7156/g.17968 Transcript_7156/m.17968 type:complete len:373 (+) Transcript_7156:204-1322(+)|eukprot:CAMPEP_0172398266 /NCGR_PEP_ID=MMETSP1061-20121228/34915_1 /TAXON_ID=37318 /ORGANISM="Pseudo-nitzschia pungens, Strain cf. pungens" /LENGTH=372 /DNA_ID=CAMNT_0013130677 /DNA_START=66 /DNA_END=1184 /DNA_ORIENTATION=+
METLTSTGSGSSNETDPLYAKESRQQQQQQHQQEDSHGYYEYYGRNDWRPMKAHQKACVCVTLLVLSPIVLIFLVLYIVMALAMCFFVPMNDHQIKSAKMLGLEFYWRTPGKLLTVRETTTTTSSTPTPTPTKSVSGAPSSADILIPDEFFVKNYDETGEKKLDTLKRFSLRKSIEYTVQEDLRGGPFGTRIGNDSDNDRPHFLLHGWTDPYDPTNNENNGNDGDDDDKIELWCTHARTATWAAIYSWSGRLPPGGWTNWSRTIDLETAPEVLGYVYLLEVANPGFYDVPRIARIGALAVNAPNHTPETKNKVFARFNYGQSRTMGDFPKGDPDAFVFKGRRVFEEANIRILRQYRVMNPLFVCDGGCSNRA